MKKLITLILCVFLFQIGNAQNDNTLKGKIFDNHKTPLENVNITIKNSGQGTTTSSNGTFELQTTADKIVLLVSNLGFETQEINVDFRKNKITTIQIQLNAITYQLEKKLL